MLKHQIKVIQALASALTEAGRGSNGTPFPRQPDAALKLYEFEGSPFCRRVREVLTLLNLDYQVYPCPKGGQRFRAVVKQQGGKLQFPFLIDENTGDRLYESEAIIAHLFQHYGMSGQTPKAYAHYPKIPYLALAGTVLNGARGVFVDKNITERAQPKQLLQLWGFEASPFTRIVRARLSELELAYQYYNVAKERWQDQGLAVLRLKPGKYQPLPAGKRERVVEVMGRHTQDIQVPYFVDPNTGAAIFESEAIIDYLNAHYATNTSVA